MRNMIKLGFTTISLATMVACGGDKPAVDPSTQTTSTPPPAMTTPSPDSKPAMNDAKPVDSAMGGGTGAGADTTPAKLSDKPLSDAEIVMITSTANNGEIDMAKLAKAQGTSPDVKSFAAMMITQHTDMEAKGKALAAKAKITPADNDASTALKSDVASTITSLKNQKGKDFDKAYMESQVKAHRDVLNMFDNKLLPSAQNSDLKSLLTAGRAHVAAHLAKAEEIQTKLDAAGSGGAKPASTTPTKK